MNGTAADASSDRVNPFPGVPEVTAGSGDQPTVTILTEAVRMTRKFVDDYINGGAGRSLAIVGDYGAGKSHIASDVIIRLRERDSRVVICVVSAGGNDTVHSIYGRIFDEHQAHGTDGTMYAGLHRIDITRRIEEIYERMERERRARIEASSGIRGGLPADLHEVSSAEFPEQPVSLAELLAGDVELTRALQSRMHEITGNREFADGLSLLMHTDPEIADHAWNWLRGGSVTSDIAKRGVENPIENNSRARIALCAIARLFTRTGIRFVLIVDDIERIGGRNGNLDYAVDAALNPLLAWTAETRSLLVISGLATAWRDLPEGVQQRVSKVISQDPFTRGDIVNYQKNAYGRIPIANPRFTQGAFDRLLDISGGLPRKVVSICYNAYEQAGASRTITGLTIQKASLASTRMSVEAMTTRVRESCARLGLLVVPEYPVGGVKAPLWIPSVSGDAGCAIVVSGPIVNTATANRVTRLGKALKEGSVEPSLLRVALVFAGHIATSQQAKVREAFTHVLRGDQEGFGEDLQALVGNVMSRLDAQAGSRLLHELHDDVRRLLVAAQDEGRLRAMIREEAHRAYLRSPRNTEVVLFGTGYEELQRVFNEAVSMIRKALTQAEGHWLAMFTSEPAALGIHRASAPGTRTTLSDDLTQDTIIQVMGVLSSLDYSFDSFGRALLSVLGLEEVKRGTRRSWLSYQCGHFDESVEDLISAIPSSDEDSGNAIQRVLGVNRQAISLQVQSFGAWAFDQIFPPRKGVH